MQLADALESGHRLADAERAARTAVHLAPALPIAHLLLGKVLHRAGSPDTRAVLEPLLEGGLPPPLMVEAHTLLAERARDDGDPSRAFAHYEAANQIAKNRPEARALRAEGPSALPFSRAWIERWADFVEQTQLTTWPRASGDEGDEDPVFLMGFPRSGTTLLGRILGAHPGLEVLEEEAAIEPALSPLLDPVTGLYDLGRLTPNDLDAARRRYQTATAKIRKQPSRRLVDKLPLHTARLPVLACVFPNARFVLPVRDPRDACLSCFMQNFGLNPAMAAFLDLEDTARYHRATFRVLWRSESALAPPLHPVVYERLVDDLEGSIRPLLSFLGLPWSDGILDYRASTRRQGIRTPSYRQVARPLNRDAVERWRAYPEAVARMAPWLEATAARYGYPPASTSRAG